MWMNREGKNRTGIRKKSAKCKKGDREQKRKQKIGRTEKNWLKRIGKERKTSRTERRTNKDITKLEGRKKKRKNVKLFSKFQNKERKKKTEWCSCCLHDQQDLCWGELASRDASEELQEPQSQNIV